MKRRNKFLSVLIVVVMVFSLLPMGQIADYDFVGLFGKVFAADVVNSGTCGDNLTWTFDSNGLLSIDGAGDMIDFPLNNTYAAPWSLYSNSIKSVKIGDNVTSIGAYAFQFCNTLTSIHIGKSVTEIRSRPVNGSRTIVSYSVSENNPVYSNDSHGVLFNKDKSELICYPCSNASSSYSIPNSVKVVGKESFLNSDKLESVDIPNSVTAIEESAFEGCYSLTSVTFGNSIVSIGASAFESCSKLPFINIPASVKTIGEHAFRSTKISEVTIPNSVLSIGQYAFFYCLQLESVTIGSSVSFIGKKAFGACYNLESITVSNNNPYFLNDERGVLYNKEKTQLIQYPTGNSAASYVIPGSVTTVEEDAFNNCDFESISIPDSITSIIPNMFEYCRNLKSVVIPWSVSFIGGSAFMYCDALEMATIFNRNCYIVDDPFTFYSCPKICGYPGSTAEQYALKYDKTFVELSCDHNRTERKNAVEPSCIDGYTGDLYCNDCGKLIEEGEPIPATGIHKWSKWVNFDIYSANAYRIHYCEICGAHEQESIAPRTFDTDGSFINKSDGVEVDFPSGAFPEGTKMNTQHWSRSDVENDNILEAWYIEFEKDGEEVQPTKPVILKLKLPNGIHESMLPYLTLWHYYNGEWIRMETWFEDGYICTITDCFSPFAVNFGEVPDESYFNDSGSNDNVCKWCGETHNGILGKITQLFHNILFFFAHLFGRM